MPRTARAAVGGVCYHVLNRGNARRTIFHKPADFDAFVQAARRASELVSMRVLAWCLMPNHFHLVLWPEGDLDLSRWMHRLMNTHVRRYHRHYHGSGHVWQGRVKAFPIEADEHLLTVLRYVERNPLRGKEPRGQVHAGQSQKGRDSFDVARATCRLFLRPPTAQPIVLLVILNKQT